MIKITPGTPIPDLAFKTAARFLGVSDTPIKKGLAAGVIPDLSLTTVDKLSRLGILENVESVTGARVPILRQSPAAPATDDPEGAEWRPFSGYQQGMTDAHCLAASDRWWTQPGRTSVLEAGAMIVACGGITLVWLDISGVSVDEPTGLLHYHATIVARVDDVLTGVVRILDPTSPNAAIAAAVLGLRVLGGRGGSITRLEPATTID